MFLVLRVRNEAAPDFTSNSCQDDHLVVLIIHLYVLEYFGIANKMVLVICPGLGWRLCHLLAALKPIYFFGQGNLHWSLLQEKQRTPPKSRVIKLSLLQCA